MTLRKLVQQLLGVSGDPTNLEEQVMVRVSRVGEGGSVVAYRVVPIARTSIHRPGKGLDRNVVDIVIDHDDLEAAKEVIL